MTIDELLYSMDTDPNPGNNDEIVDGVCKIIHAMEPIAQRWQKRYPSNQMVVARICIMGY